MATTSTLTTINVFDSEDSYNANKNNIGENDISLVGLINNLIPVGGGIVAQLLEPNGYIKFANGLILQWGYTKQNTVTLPIAYTKYCCVAMSTTWGYASVKIENLAKLTFIDAHSTQDFSYIIIGV